MSELIPAILVGGPLDGRNDLSISPEITSASFPGIWHDGNARQHKYTNSGERDEQGRLVFTYQTSEQH